MKFSTSYIFQNYYIRIGFVFVFIATSLTVLKEVTFQDRATGEIHKLLPRLYRFTKIPYAQCTLLKKSKNISLRGRTERCIDIQHMFPVESIEWGCLQPYSSQHCVGTRVWFLCWYKKDCLLHQGTQHHYAIWNQPTAFLCGLLRKYRHCFVFTFL